MNLPPLNAREPMVDADRRPSKTFLDLWTHVSARQEASAARVGSATTQPGLSAAVSTTALELGALSAGYYRVSVYVRVTTAATVSSSITPTIAHTDNGIACSQAGDALTANSVSVPKSWTFVVYADASSPISYSVAYASVGATAAVYKVTIVVEEVSV